MKFHTFYTDDLPEQIVTDHRKCAEKFGIEVIYHSEKYINYDSTYTSHGKYMTKVLNESSDDVLCFLDIDSLIYDGDFLKNLYNWVNENKSFIGNAQNISHTVMRNRLYAAAPMLIIHKKSWDILGNPNLNWFIQDHIQIDTAQILSLRADEIGFPYRLLYPIGYDGDNHRSLGTYGNYGTGTLYPGSYHYFRISDFKESIPDLWKTRVNNILNNQKIIPNYSSCFYGL